MIFVEEKRKPNLDCPECENIFSEREEWIEHSEKFHGKLYKKYDKNHTCYICGSTNLKSEKDLKNHCLSAHKVDKPYQCGKCFETFTYKKILRFHIRDVHELVNFGQKQHILGQKKSYQCPMCEDDYSEKSEWIKHLKFHEKKSDEIEDDSLLTTTQGYT